MPTDAPKTDPIKTDAANKSVSATDDTKEPARVETATAVVDPTFDEDVNAILADLVDMHRKAIEAGHTLTEVLVVAAKNAFGIDIRPTPPEPKA